MAAVRYASVLRSARPAPTSMLSQWAGEWQARVLGILGLCSG